MLNFAIDAFYKGIDNIIIHAVEHDMVRTQDIIFDYLTTGKKSPVVKLNHPTNSDTTFSSTFPIFLQRLNV